MPAPFQGLSLPGWGVALVPQDESNFGLGSQAGVTYFQACEWFTRPRRRTARHFKIAMSLGDQLAKSRSEYREFLPPASIAAKFKWQSIANALFEPTQTLQIR